MIPRLETLESRDMPDAALAAAFVSGPFPVWAAGFAQLSQQAIQQLQTLEAIALAQVDTLGPRGFAQYAPTIVSLLNQAIAVEVALGTDFLVQGAAFAQQLLAVPSGNGLTGT